MSLLTIVEESTLHDLDAMVDWYKKHKPDVRSIVVTQRQYNALMRISEKTEKGPVLRREGDLDLKGNNYRGFEIITREQTKRRRKKDNIDIDDLLGAGNG